MIITCEACGTSFKVKSSMIKETGSTVRCSKCQYLFIAYPPTAEPVTPIELLPDEKIETSIDETFGREADEKIISDIFGEEEPDEDVELDSETDAELRDLEAEIDADMTTLSQKIDEDLFDDTEIRLDAIEEELGEPELFISDLEEDTTEMLDLEDFEDTDASTIDLGAISIDEADDVIDLEALVQDAGEEEVFLDDLESADEGNEIILEDLEDHFEEDMNWSEEPETSENGAVDQSPEEEDSVDFEALEAAQESETIFAETISFESENDEESVESDEMDEAIIIEDFEIGKDDVAQPEFADFRDLETVDENGISLETVGADDELDEENLERADAEKTEVVDFGDIDFEAEGGVDNQLEEFDAEKESGVKKPKAPPADTEAEFDLDFDIELEETADAGSKAGDAKNLEYKVDQDAAGTETREFELDLEAELDDMLAEEKAPDAEELDLEFDLDEPAAVETTAETEEFELDLEENVSSGMANAGEEEISESFELDFETELDDVLAEEKAADAGELDLEFDLDEPAAVQAAAETEEFELDLEEDVSPGMETADEMEEFDLGFEGEEPLADMEEPAVSFQAGEEDIGLDLDLDAFDLDLENVEAEDIGEEDFDFDLEAEDLDLKTQTFGTDADELAEDEEGAFDLDLEVASDDKPVSAEEDLIFDLDIEPEEKSGATEEEFELDFEEALEEEPGPAGTIEDWDGAEVASATETGGGLDLSEIEDFLDFGEEETTEAPESAEAESIERVVEFESDTLDMDMDLDFETVTAPEEEEEAGEIEIDLETMIDEEIGMEKEVSLETTEERQRRITEEYRNDAVFAEELEEESGEIIDDTALEADAAAVGSRAEPVRDKRRLMKPILIVALVLLLSGILIYAGITFFGAPPEVPEMVDPTGRLRIEMVQNPEYAFVANESAGELLVVTGHVTNRYDQPRSHIQVQATIYDATGEIVATSVAYCGNMLSDSDLSGLDMETINRRLSNREGDANANVNVQPGGRVPFTVVFNNLPDNIDEMTVEVVASAM
jgi:pilus assembly protein FimV